MLEGKILIVDDSEDWRSTIKGTLTDLGVSSERIITPDNLQDVIAGLSEFGMSLMLVTLDNDIIDFSDFGYSGINQGRDLVVPIRQESPDCRILALHDGSKKDIPGADTFLDKLDFRSFEKVVKDLWTGVV